MSFLVTWEKCNQMVEEERETHEVDTLITEKEMKHTKNERDCIHLQSHWLDISDLCGMAYIGHMTFMQRAHWFIYNVPEHWM